MFFSCFVRPLRPAFHPSFLLIVDTGYLVGISGFRPALRLLLLAAVSVGTGMLRLPGPPGLLWLVPVVAVSCSSYFAFLRRGIDSLHRFCFHHLLSPCYFCCSLAVFHICLFPTRLLAVALMYPAREVLGAFSDARLHLRIRLRGMFSIFLRWSSLFLVDFLCFPAVCV